MVAAAPAVAEESQDALLRLYYGAKVGISVLGVGAALTDPEASTTGRLVAGSASLLVGIPATLVLAQAGRHGATAVRSWRIAAFIVDAALSSAAVGAGVYLWARPDSTISDEYAGLGFVMLGLAGAIACSADLVPFAAERR